MNQISIGGNRTVVSLDVMILTCAYLEHVSFVLGKNLDFARPASRLSGFQSSFWRCCASCL